MKHSKHQDHFDTRRNFLCRSACASLGVTSVVNTLAHLRLVQGVAAQGAPSDYKALVCLFLYGGNDSNNMLLPLNGEARQNYDLARPESNPIHISASSARSLNAPSGGFGQTSATQFGLHPQLAFMQQRFNQSTPDLAFVANVGTLVVPIDRTEYLTVPRVKPVPPQLFSHSDQQVQWQSSLPDRPFQNGWGGRTADILHSLANPASQVSMNISINGQNSFQVASNSVQYAVSTNGVTPLSGYGTNYVDGVNSYGSPPDYKANNQGRTLKGVDLITKLARMQLGEEESRYQHLLEDGYNDVMKRARDNEAIVGTALGAATNLIDDAFDYAFGWSGTGTRPTLPDIANQLKMTVRLMQGRSSLGNNRQIFFVGMGGYDTHQSQASSHATLMSNLDNALKGFRDAIHAIEPSLWNDTLLFSNSDFTRTFQPNGTLATSGTDHGWGGHQIVLGGPVIGGKIYGSFPNLARSSGQDVDSNRGRWIPTTAVEQFMSVAAKWFMSEGTDYFGGIGEAQIAGVFPNLNRFQTVGAIPTHLQYLNFTV